jgi:WD40 repeat protein
MRLIPVLALVTYFAVANSALTQPAQKARVDVNGDPLPEGAVARLGTVRFQSSDPIRNVAVSPNGPTVAAISPDGTTVATATTTYELNGTQGTRINFMDTLTGKWIRKIELASFDCNQMQFTSEGKRLVVVGSAGITMIDVITGRATKSVEQADLVVRLNFSFALTSDNSRVAVQTWSNAYDTPVGVWDTKTGKQVVMLPGRGAQCNGVALSPDGKRLLLWSRVPTRAEARIMEFGDDSKVIVACIDVEMRKIVREITVGNATYVALSPDGETVAVEDPDHQRVEITHLLTGTRRCAISAKNPKFVFGPNGKSLFIIEHNGQAAVWDAMTGEKTRDLEGAVANADFRIVGISKNGQTLAVVDGGWNSTAVIAVWNVSTGKRVGGPSGHDGAVTCIAYAPDGNVLASGSLDKTIRIWNPRTGEHVRKLAVHKAPVTAVKFSGDGKLLASSSQDGVTLLLNSTDGKVLKEFVGPERGATALAFSPDSRLLFAGGASPEVLVWETSGTKEVGKLKTGDDGCVMAIADGGASALTANGEIRAEGIPERLQIWNPTNRDPVISISIGNGDAGTVRCGAAVFSLDGRLVASSQISAYEGIRPSFGGARLCLWERVSGQPIRTLAAAITEVLGFSPNGRLLAAGGIGKSGHLNVGYASGIDVWDVVTGNKAFSIPATPSCVAFSPDGSQLATGGRDQDILIWDVPNNPSPKNAKAPSAAQFNAWWTALGGNAQDAYTAMGQMIETPEFTVDLLKKKISPVQAGEPNSVLKLIAQLDAPTYGERMKAQSALESMGEGAAHIIRETMTTNLTLEVRRRLQDLLQKCTATSRLSLQHHRSVTTLEWIGTPSAGALLRTLASGAPGARLTSESAAALKRLKG